MMYSVSTELYLEVASRLRDAIGDGSYFSGTLTFDFGEVACRLTASVIVCRERVRYPEGDRDEISDLVPVWWEFHTSDDGGEFLNDFSFSDLRSFL
ncbi:hypothetical protein [uncultured Alistipes sp.]|uniref:hypothetical protein n=1 Tax=uncultured Alistipes sp. TaxID=538949 RepID=UPI003207DE0E